MISLQNAFEPSSSAPSAPGPKHAIPAAASASATPATSGASGPTTTSRHARRARRRDDGSRRPRRRAVEHPRLRRDAGIPRSAEHLRRLRRAPQRLDDRVLARAAPRTRTRDAAQIEPMKSSIGIATQRLVLAGSARAELQRHAGDDLLVRRLDDVDEVELTERRPLRLDGRAELLDLAVDLRIRAGLFLIVCTPSGVSVVSMM